MKPEIDDANSASRSVLRAVADRLSESHMVQPLSGPWTPAAVYAHLAFWDRFCRARWLHAQGTDIPTPLPLEDALLELINHADLPHWARVPPAAAIEECLEAAEQVDELISSLGDDTADKIQAEGRPRLIDRSIHRHEHLAMIEAVFPTGA
jgi:hypothetical protein